MTDLRGLVLSVFDQDLSGTVLALPLRGVIDQDGFYVIGNVTEAGERRWRQLFRRTPAVRKKCIYVTLWFVSLLDRSDVS